ncbi:GAF domain-containing protein [Luteibaculum oceani]|uniref:GAF domain-containing protein n=1 Tax=Luteibaculum oceani TaxID=1294296 RepID=A0A5C6USB1_9FLAO|nr:GAF domain-containing protein [Luteibaculum oceani]TXC76222.1 hypothetical protein FRX97_10770 [Luteibaculum oceani]
MTELLKLKLIDELQLSKSTRQAEFEELEELVHLASEIAGFPIAALTIVEANEINFHVSKGIPFERINRDPGLCTSALNGNDIYYIPDTQSNDLAKTNSLVSGPFNIRSYIGFPITIAENYKLGTLALMDHEPRIVAEKDLKSIRKIGKIIERVIANRKKLLQEQSKVKDQLDVLRTFLDSTSNAMAYLDRNYKIQYLNQACKDICVELFNKSPDPGDNAFNYILPENLEHLKKSFREVFKGKSLEFEQRSRDIHLKIHLNPVMGTGSKKVMGIVVSIHDNTREIEKRRQLAKHKKILDQIAWDQTHLIRNPLVNILSLSELIEDKLKGIGEGMLAKMLRQTAQNLDDIIIQTFQNVENERNANPDDSRT